MNTSGETNRSSVPGPTDYHYDLVRSIQFYSLSVIIPMGIITNILALYVFYKSSMKRTTAGHYLIALSIADTFLLYGEFLKWLNSFRANGTFLGITFMNDLTLWCCLITFIRYFGRLWSSWITVIITVERYITVAFPLRVASMSTITKAKIVILTEMILTAAAGSYPFFTVESQPLKNSTTLRCLIHNAELYNIWNWLVIRCFELIAPSVLVVIFTTLIILKITKASSMRKQLSQGMRTREARRAFHDHQVTLVLIGVAMSFVILKTPYVVIFNINDKKKKIWGDELDVWASFWIYAIYCISYVLSVLNYATHFFIFCLCGTAFRVEMTKVFCKKKRLSDTTLTFVSQRSRTDSQKLESPPNGRTASRTLHNGTQYTLVGNNTAKCLTASSSKKGPSQNKNAQMV